MQGQKVFKNGYGKLGRLWKMAMEKHIFLETGMREKQEKNRKSRQSLVGGFALQLYWHEQNHHQFLLDS